MYRLLLFLKRITVFVLFVLIEVLALRYYTSSSVYSKGKIVGAANATVGALSSNFYQAGSYFSLAKENQALNQEIAELRNKLDRFEADTTTMQFDYEQQYNYIEAKVVDNTVTKQYNYIILNKGMRDGAHENMAVISGDNIVGYVVSVSDKFSAAISLLNRDFRSSGQLKGIDYVGSIFWDGIDNEHLILTEMSKYASISAGDTVVSTGYSTIFPPNITIGTVEDFRLVNDTYYDIKVKIGAHMSGLTNVTLASYINAVEKETLLEEAQNQAH